MLAVDDSHVIRRLVEVSLDPLNMLVTTAESGGDACDRLLASRPDLLILDLGLPDMPGWKVLEYARGEPALDGLPVILLTGYDEADDRDRAECIARKETAVAHASEITLCVFAWSDGVSVDRQRSDIDIRISKELIRAIRVRIRVETVSVCVFVQINRERRSRDVVAEPEWHGITVAGVGNRKRSSET